jgi:hypothetical protein
MAEHLKTDALAFLLTEPIYVIAEESTPPVALPTVEIAIPEPPQPKVDLSRNRNQVVIIYNNQQTVYLNPEEEALLTKILGAVKLRLDDVELVNIHNHRDTLVEILKDKVVNQIISFGIELRDLDIQIPLEAYRITRAEGIDILLADSLFELQLNTDKKKMLWQSLQSMFLIGQRK